MAVLNLSITIPDVQLPRIQEAARNAWGPMTNAEIVERLRQETIQTLKGLVHRYERNLAVSTAENASYDLDAT